MLYYLNVHMVFINSECCDGNRADNYSSSSDQKLPSHILEVGQPGNFLPMMLSAPRQPRERV